MGKLTGMHVVLSDFTGGIRPLTVNAGEPNEELSNSTVVKGLCFFNLVESLYLGEYVLNFFSIIFLSLFTCEFISIPLILHSFAS